METAHQTSIQGSRPELILPVRQFFADGLPGCEEDPISSAEKAYLILREMILNLDYPPGSVIRDTDLSAKLGFGRTPIREALKRLEVEMLVVSHHRRGTFVSELTLADIKRQYQIRRQLLTLAVALASQAERVVLSQLEKKSHHLASMTGKYSLEVISQSIAELEENIAEASANPFLRLTLRQYCGYAQRACHLLKPVLSVDDLQLEDYSKIMAWAGKQDGERSSQLMALHVDQVHLKMVDRFLEKFI